MSGRMIVGEAVAGWPVEEQTRHSRKKMKKQLRARLKEIEKAIDTALARVGSRQRGESRWRSTASRYREGSSTP